MKRKIILISLVLFLVILLRGCYLFAFCEYKSVFVLPDAKDNQIIIADSLCIYPNLRIESHIGVNGDRVMAAYLTFEEVTDSVTLKSINVEVSCVDNPQQKIYMTHVITYVDPLIPERIDYVSAQKFTDLPEHYKIVTAKRQPWNGLRFYFQAKDIDLGTFYSLKINGVLVYKGKLINISKEIPVKREKQWVPYQMMT